MATQTIPEFSQVPERYGLHNARPEQFEVLWGGQKIILPPVDAIGPRAVLDSDGRPLPGTVMVQDSYQINADGSFPAGGTFNWKAREAIQGILGIEPHTQKATSPVAMNGISYLPMGCDRGRYETIKKDGERRYRASLVTWATDTVQAYEVARSKAKEAGVEARPVGPEFYRAQAILKAHQKDLQMSMGAEVAGVEQAADDEELEFEIFAKAIAMKLAAKVADRTAVDKAALVEEMLKDPDVSAKIRRKYSLRKRGYLPVDDPDGAGEQPDSQPDAPAE